VWTLDRTVVPEASDREELQYPFGMMTDFPPALPVIARGEWFQGFPLLPWLAAKTTTLRIGMSIIDTPFRAPGALAAELATIDHLRCGRLNVGVGSGWMPEGFAAASATHIFPKRHKHVRETLEIMQGIWTNDLFEYHGEFADFEPCGFGHKPPQKHVPADLLQRAQGPEALGAAHREVQPVGLDRDPGLARPYHRRGAGRPSPSTRSTPSNSSTPTARSSTCVGASSPTRASRSCPRASGAALIRTT
jgi:alkanesulfonate monooxygenase SsuD/methylene tetrahydromethanopterin reductase-like flavin-dependent oxidoreductase (luciferase family)